MRNFTRNAAASPEVRTLAKRWGVDLAEWLDRVARMAEQWQVEPDTVLPGASCSLVVAGRRASRAVVLKLPVVGEERTSGHLAAASFAAHGGIGILEHDPETGALLMPRLDPGHDLRSLADEDAQIEVAIALIRRLREAPSGPGTSLKEWFLSFSGRDFARPIRLLNHMGEAEATRIHGDLHHMNILRHGDDWVAIDPKGILADRAAEPAAFLRNHLGSDDLEATLEHRIRRFAVSLDDPVERVWAWGWLFTVEASSPTDPVVTALERIGERTGWAEAVGA